MSFSRDDICYVINKFCYFSNFLNSYNCGDEIDEHTYIYIIIKIVVIQIML